MANVIAIGPFGGAGGESWDDGSSYTGVREIMIHSGLAIDSLQLVYDKDGVPSPGEKHGGGGGGENTEKLDFPREYLTALSGYYGDFGGNTVILSLTFWTNYNKSYQFGGNQTGTYFEVPLLNAKIVGFKGRNGDNLDAITVYAVPL